MPNIFKQEVSLIFCQIYYFSKTDERKGRENFFTVWVHDGKVVKCPLNRLDLVRGMDAAELVDAMRKDGWSLDVI